MTGLYYVDIHMYRGWVETVRWTRVHERLGGDCQVDKGA